MFVAASAEEIPWQDGFFTRVLDPVGLWANSTKANGNRESAGSVLKWRALQRAESRFISTFLQSPTKAEMILVPAR
jgi:hypothetical protein